MEKIYEGLSVSLPEADIELLNQRLELLKKDYQEAARNDSDFVGSLKREAEGKVYHSVERWLKKATGVELENVDGDLKGGDRFKAALDIAVNSIKATKDHTNQELQDQLLKVKDDLRKVKEEDMPELEATYQRKYDEKNIETALVGKMPELNVIPERSKAAQIYLNAVLKDRYQTRWQDGIAIQTKDGLKPVIDDKPATTDQVLKAILDEGGFIQKSNGTPAPTPGVKGSPERAAKAKDYAASYGVTI